MIAAAGHAILAKAYEHGVGLGEACQPYQLGGKLWQAGGVSLTSVDLTKYIKPRQDPSGGASTAPSGSGKQWMLLPSRSMPATGPQSQSIQDKSGPGAEAPLVQVHANSPGRWSHLEALLPLAPGSPSPGPGPGSSSCPGALLPSAPLAALHWRRAAALGDPHAQATVAGMYSQGILGVRRNPGKAASLLSFAAAGRGLAPLPGLAFDNAHGQGGAAGSGDPEPNQTGHQVDSVSSFSVAATLALGLAQADMVSAPAAEQTGSAAGSAAALLPASSWSQAPRIARCAAASAHLDRASDAALRAMRASAPVDMPMRAVGYASRFRLASPQQSDQLETGHWMGLVGQAQGLLDQENTQMEFLEHSMLSDPSVSLELAGRRLMHGVAQGPQGGWTALVGAYEAALQATIGMMDADGGGALEEHHSASDVIESLEGAGGEVHFDELAHAGGDAEEEEGQEQNDDGGKGKRKNAGGSQGQDESEEVKMARQLRRKFAGALGLAGRLALAGVQSGARGNWGAETGTGHPEGAEQSEASLLSRPGGWITVGSTSDVQQWEDAASRHADAWSETVEVGDEIGTNACRGDPACDHGSVRVYSEWFGGWVGRDGMAEFRRDYWQVSEGDVTPDPGEGVIGQERARGDRLMEAASGLQMLAAAAVRGEAGAASALG